MLTANSSLPPESQTAEMTRNERENENFYPAMALGGGDYADGELLSTRTASSGRRTDAGLTPAFSAAITPAASQ